MPELVLLCHANELAKPSNTGQLIGQCLQQIPATTWQIRTIIWQRKLPDAALLQALSERRFVLLYPCEQAELVHFDMPSHLQKRDKPVLAQESLMLSAVDGVILLESTWQQAQKIFNHSPYLQQLAKWRAHSSYHSRYNGRRNQRENAWCTAETAALLFEFLRYDAEAQALWQLFEARFVD